jgi:hypothetical protein
MQWHLILPTLREFQKLADAQLDMVRMTKWWEGRISMLWLVDGSVHLISDYWEPKTGDTEFRFLGSHEPVHPVPTRDGAKQ